MKIKILTTLVCFLCLGLVQVTAQEEVKKESKKIVIVTKIVDADGIETVERIVKVGAEADDYIKEMHVGEDCIKEIKICIKSSADGENIWISDNNDVLNLDCKKFEFLSEGVSLNGNFKKKFKIVSLDENGQEEVIEWDGEGDMPEALKKQLEEKGINIKSLEGGKGMFILKTDGVDGIDFDHNFKFDFKGLEGLSPEMKTKIHKLHKEKGELHEVHDFVFKSSKMNTNKAFLGVNIENIEDVGVKVVSVIEGSAAEEAGILAGDIIKTISGKEANNVDQLIEALNPFNPGDEVAINLDRAGVATKVLALLKERSDIHVFGDFDEEDGDGNIEIIIIKDCDMNFSGDEDIDFLFKTIVEEDGVKEITKEIIITIEGIEGVEIIKEVEVIAEVVVEEAVEEVEEVKEVKEAIELAPIVKSSRLKNMDRLKLKGFKAFPNPTDGLLNVSFTGKKGPLVIQMTDINGRQMYKKTVNDFDGYFDDQISFDGLPKGTYVLYIIQQGQVYTDNIIFN